MINHKPMNSAWLAGSRRAGAALLLCAGVLGCGGGSLPDRANPEKARQALQTALDAWHKGESIEALAQRTPAIYFNDPKATSGMRLASFEIDDTHDFFGQSVRISVKASVEKQDGASKERKLTYLIDTSPVVVIVPD